MKKPFVVVFFIFVSGVFGQCHAATDPCEGIAFPQPVSALLQKSFANWRVEKLSDLDASDQNAWTKKYPNGCPGLVIGHFQDASSIGYAFLLLPSDQIRKGYRLVVFTERVKDHWQWVLIEKDDQRTPPATVISLAAAGEYQQAEGSKKIRTTTEGIFSEDMGIGVMIYYWHVDRFRNLVISD